MSSIIHQEKSKKPFQNNAINAIILIINGLLKSSKKVYLRVRIPLSPPIYGNLFETKLLFLKGKVREAKIIRKYSP
jgi:hypothetical protein